MKEKPILFSTPMVRAILSGQKTQTRRIVNADLVSNLDFDENDKNYLYVEDKYGDWNPLLDYSPVKKDNILYVRETFCLGEYTYIHQHDEGGKSYFIDQSNDTATIIYRADIFKDIDYVEEIKVKWKPSIFLPKTDSRIWLKVINVRVEKLQDISENDAKAEGFKDRDSFHELWDKLNEKRGYGRKKNPYVWIYEFEKFDK